MGRCAKRQGGDGNERDQDSRSGKCSGIGCKYHQPANAADDMVPMKTVEAAFDTVFQDLTDAVVNRGLVIDYTGHVDTMLSRTASVAGSGKSPYANARYMQFCSSTLTHEAVAADASNISMCPYLVFAYETTAEPGKVVIGFRPPDLRNDDASKAVRQKVEKLLGQIVSEAADQ
jgi:hypothetical protein